MRNDGEYGTIAEIEGFSILCNIRITCYTRFVSGDKKEHKDKINRKACGIEYDENFEIMLTDYGKDREENNHFEVLIPRDGFNIEKNKLKKYENYYVLLIQRAKTKKKK